MIHYLRIPALICLLAGTTLSHAQTVYVTDSIQVGLHAEKSLTSPIVKLVPSGTALEVVKTEDLLSFVRDPAGVGGWIDNSYLQKQRATAAAEVEQRIRSLEQELATARAGAVPTSITATEIEGLQETLEEERQRSEALQTELDELKGSQSRAADNEALYQKIDALAGENRLLKDQLAGILEAPGQSDTTVTVSTLLTPMNILLALGIVLVIGIIAGVMLMDYLHRRRHGGFRI